jgi:hypothetical protein
MSVTIRCDKHIRYNGAESPKGGCETCMELYLLRLRAEAARLRVVTK